MMKQIRRLQMFKGMKPTINLPIKTVKELGWKEGDNLIIDENLKKKSITISRVEF